MQAPHPIKSGGPFFVLQRAQLRQQVSGKRLFPQRQPLGAGVWTFEDVSEKRPVSAELTPREREIAALLVEGKTSKMIARDPDLSPRTVEMHRASLMRKFAASTSSELVHKLVGVSR